jgi:hypothetical protein
MCIIYYLTIKNNSLNVAIKNNSFNAVLPYFQKLQVLIRLMQGEEIQYYTRKKEKRDEN